MASTLGPLHKHKDQKNSRVNNADILSGAAATAGVGASGANERSGGGGRGGKPSQRRWPDTGRSGKDNTDGRPPATRKHTCELCVAKTKPSPGHPITACPWISSTSKSDLLTTLPNLCLGCLKLKSTGTHKCPNYLSDGQSHMKFFALHARSTKNFVKPQNCTLQALFLQPSQAMCQGEHFMKRKDKLLCGPRLVSIGGV